MKVNARVWRVLLICLWCIGQGSAIADDQPGKPVVIDVRTPVEFGENHLVGALNLDFTTADFAEQVDKLDKSASYRLYCRTGNRSAQAAEMMKKLGFADVQSVGGLKDAASKLQMKCAAGGC
jgi:phage shock protein E